MSRDPCKSAYPDLSFGLSDFELHRAKRRRQGIVEWRINKELHLLRKIMDRADLWIGQLARLHRPGQRHVGDPTGRLASEARGGTQGNGDLTLAGTFCKSLNDRTVPCDPSQPATAWNRVRRTSGIGGTGS